MEGFIEPFENKKGFTLRILRVASVPVAALVLTV